MKKGYKLYEMMNIEPDWGSEYIVLRPMGDLFDTLEEAEAKVNWWYEQLRNPYPITIIPVYRKGIDHEQF